MQNGWNKQEGVTVVDPGAKKKKNFKKIPLILGGSLNTELFVNGFATQSFSTH